MVSDCYTEVLDDAPKSLVCRASKECADKGMFVGLAGSFSVRQEDCIYIGPTGSQVRSSDLREDQIFTVALDDGNTVLESPYQTSLKMQEMAPVHFGIYKAHRQIGAVLECRSTTAIVGSLVIKTNRVTSRDPSIVLGPTSHSAQILMPVVDYSADVKTFTETICSQLKVKTVEKKVNGSAEESTTKGEPTKELAKPDPVQVEDGSPVTAAEFTVPIVSDEETKAEEEKVTELPAPLNMDSDISCSAVIVRNKGFFVWGRNWIECINRAEHINQIFEVMIQLEQVDLNPYSQLTISGGVYQKALTAAAAAQKLQSKQVALPTKGEEDNSVESATVPKRPRIEPPSPEVKTEENSSEETTTTAITKPAAAATAPAATASSPAKKQQPNNKKRKWTNNKSQQQQQNNRQKQPVPLASVRVVGGGGRGGRGGQGGRGRGGHQQSGGPRNFPAPHRRMQMPSPWALQPQGPPNAFGGYY